MTDAHTAGPFIAAIDQGTTSSRCAIFDREGRTVSVDRPSTTLTVALHETLDLSRLLRACRTPPP